MPIAWPRPYGLRRPTKYISLSHRTSSTTRPSITTMIAKTAVVLALVAVAVAAPTQPSYGYTPAPAYEEPAKYDFNYAVKDDYSGNDFGHQESRDGYDTQGSYYVLLPDGRLQKVDYTVNGDSGYVAEVTYDGEPQYPAAQPSYTPAPAYA
ncbi:cuticle protein 7-like isoform X2 [Homarus americanus]|uniref:cuticle protein 7-like isoform X2 n=1 Tax=Homarus americanus TaxID=6706 RepID=UPI001C46A3F4|nr:cuticle protein 7-like isoform X2 [Homarus americanus]